MRWFPAHSMYGLCLQWYSWITEQNIFSWKVILVQLVTLKLNITTVKFDCAKTFMCSFIAELFFWLFFLLKFSKRECFKQETHIITIIQTFPYTRMSLTEQLFTLAPPGAFHILYVRKTHAFEPTWTSTQIFMLYSHRIVLVFRRTVLCLYMWVIWDVFLTIVVLRFCFALQMRFALVIVLALAAIACAENRVRRCIYTFIAASPLCIAHSSNIPCSSGDA